MNVFYRSLLIFFLLFPSLAAAQGGKINLKNADIREFAAQVSTITGKSFILDPRIKGNVTVISNEYLDNDAIYELFLNVLRVHGFAAISSGNVVRIVQQVLAKQSGSSLDFVKTNTSEAMVTRVIPVKHTPSNELVKILRPLIPQYGHIAGLNQPNVLIISDHAANITRLAEIVNRIDVVEASVTRVIALKEAWVEDMVALLERLAPDVIDKGGKGPNKITIVANTRTNSLVLKGESITLEKIAQLIATLDIPANRTNSAQVIRLAHSNAKELADILNNLVSVNSTNQNNLQKVKASIQADEALNALVIRAEPNIVAEVKDIIAKLDIRRFQVLIEAAIVEVTENFSHELGTELAFVDRGSSNVPIVTTQPSGVIASIIQSIVANGATVPAFGVAPTVAGGKINNFGSNFAFVVQALASHRDVNLLSTPSITTMDNEEARIVVGQNVPFRTGSTTTGTNGTLNPFTTIQREDVGLTLAVTPHVYDGSLIRLEINQEVSEVDQSNNISIGNTGSADLITSKRSIETTVLADNGEVIILGGLIRDRVSSNESGVPLLKDIPGIGRLFKSKTKTRDKNNLIVFLRATVLADKTAVIEQTRRKYSGIWEVEISGRDPLDAVHDLFDGKR